MLLFKCGQPQMLLIIPSCVQLQMLLIIPTTSCVQLQMLLIIPKHNTTMCSTSGAALQSQDVFNFKYCSSYHVATQHHNLVHHSCTYHYVFSFRSCSSSQDVFNFKYCSSYHDATTNNFAPQRQQPLHHRCTHRLSTTHTTTK
eukprot:11958574-Karenia_brevis.AAC.1